MCLLKRETTARSHFEESLDQFPCGPGGHTATAGLLLGNFGTDGEWIRLCGACGKRDDPATCLFCQESADRTGGQPPRQYTVEGPNGRKVSGGLCRRCYGNIAEAVAGVWTIATD
jgi:hypothetical protein